ncbi:uncharacterized protein SCHCODRAFT_02376624 [Schizophyllum commune H4-8]|uniref:uncharacterized protein n=1 Tax=Schizophyllum commune (strain H4-8 / FGSC 9210) TaxID=578458 RepID=UPI002160AAE3|nr:uncharacterized protein SCHCODRAFT_02376624 [Schizophyllum commune H4-8]KAI5889740.1 hypothetical protein SCHCODRAFT_02376624 [Schizophyllum commune H4-8]
MRREEPVGRPAFVARPRRRQVTHCSGRLPLLRIGSGVFCMLLHTLIGDAKAYSRRNLSLMKAGFSSIRVRLQVGLLNGLGILRRFPAAPASDLRAPRASSLSPPARNKTLAVARGSIALSSLWNLKTPLALGYIIENRTPLCSIIKSTSSYRSSPQLGLRAAFSTDD